MKKILVLATALIFTTSVACFADTKVTPTTKVPLAKCGPQCKKMPPKGPDFEKRRAEFEKRLNLNEEQKQKAEELHKAGFEKMKPIMEKTKEKQKELWALKDAKDEQSLQKKEQLKKEIGALRHEARELKKQNMKDFENILTKKQQKELQKMKEEGRKNFEKNFKKHPHPEFGSRPDEPPVMPKETK